jgi:DNA replication protein DnaC
MTKTESVKNRFKQLNLTVACNELDNVVLQEAEKNKVSYLELLKTVVVETEINYRMKKNLENRTKQAWLPLVYNLDLFDFSAENGIEKQQLNQLRELGVNGK